MELNECKERDGVFRIQRDVGLFDRYFGLPFFEGDCINLVPPVELDARENSRTVYVTLAGVGEKHFLKEA